MRSSEPTKPQAWQGVRRLTLLDMDEVECTYEPFDSSPGPFLTKIGPSFFAKILQTNPSQPREEFSHLRIVTDYAVVTSKIV